MCGICGYVGIEQPGLLGRMSAVLAHRGPDDAGEFESGNVGLGHRRLSIIDLAGGHQPMQTPDGAYTIAFNGEIYNFAEIRENLAASGTTFRTHSDTEVLLRLFEREGVDGLARTNGMFAFAIWDRGRRELTLARDRVGIKPLYYVQLENGGLLFASEMKSLLQYEGWGRELNPHAIRDYLSFRYVPGQTSLFQRVRRLPAGHTLVYRDGRVRISRYWSPPVPAAEPRRSEHEYLDELHELLERSVRRRLISDVSFGAYLSGGLDSSVIVALMSKLVSSPVKTFSVGFDYEHDELSEAADTARRLGCDHHELPCRAKDVNLLPEVVWHSDEPPGDPISIPMYQLAREAKKQVTVILTGEGADEIFAGYLFHKVMWGAHCYRRGLPGGLHRHLVEPAARLVPARLLDLAFRYPAYLGGRGKQKVLDYLRLIGSGSQDESYRHLISLFDERDTADLFSDDLRDQLTAPEPGWPTLPAAGPAFDDMLRLQFEHWLPDNMLHRQDKTGMASGIEGRVPYLDHELIEFAFRLPRNLRLRGVTGKYLLRRLAERLLPRATARRKKMPFYVPIEQYFEDPSFVEMMDDLLSPEAVRNRGLFRPEAVARIRAAMHAREFLLVKQGFSLVSLELWFRIFVDGAGARP